MDTCRELLSARTSRRGDESGLVLPMVLIFTLLITIMGWGVLTLAAHEGELLHREMVDRQSLYLAEAGIQRAISRLAVAEDWGELPATLYTDEAFAGGAYTVRLIIDQPAAGMVTIESDGTFRHRTRRVITEARRGF